VWVAHLLWRVLIVVALRRRAQAARAQEPVAAAAAKGAVRGLIERLVAVCKRLPWQRTRSVISAKEVL
jgi:hypothetical protein